MNLPPRTLLAAALILFPVSLGAQSYFDAPWRSFESSQTAAGPGRYLVDVATADLNGDGLDDVIAGQAVHTGGIRVFINAGQAQGPPATFEPPVFYPIQYGAWGVVEADLDGDLDLDIATTDTDTNGSISRIAVLRNDGTGVLSVAVYYPAGPQGPTGIAAADFDNDGDIDLAVANWGLVGFGNDVSILLNNGNAVFGAPTSYVVADAPFRLEAGDFDGDHIPDLAVAHDKDAAVSILFGNGNGTFAPPVVYSHIFNVVNTGTGAAVALLDADQDGDLDIAYTSSFAYNQNVNDGQLALLRNDGAGNFAASYYAYGLPYQNVAFDLAVANLDGDAFPDLVGGLYYEAGFLPFRNDGAGGFVPLPPIASADDVIAIAAPDLDGDGDSDVATVNRLYPLMGVHENPGDGLFDRLPIYGDTFVHFVLDIGDVNNDGHLDVVTSHSGAVSSSVDLYLGAGDGTFTLSYETPDFSYGFAKLRHLDQDSFLDLLFVSGPNSPPYDFFTARGNGDGTFGQVIRWPLGTCGNAHPAAFDIDEDGDLDVIVPEDRGCPGVPLSGQRLFIRLNNGDMTFQPPYIVLAGIFPRNLDAGDFNGDHHLDLAVVANATDAILFGRGDGTFEPQVAIPRAYVSDNILVRDWDDDGSLDIAALESVSEGVAAIGVLWGDGAGGFVPQSHALHPALPSRLVIATGDVDGDGDEDLFSDGEQDVILFRNDGNRSIVHAGRYGLGRDSRAIMFGDATDDGVGDILAIADTEQPSGLYDGPIVLPGIGINPAGAGETLLDAGATVLCAVDPNPFGAGARFRLEVVRAQQVTADLFDLRGRMVASVFAGAVEPGAPGGATIDGRGLASGAYWLAVKGETFETVRQVIVLR